MCKNWAAIKRHTSPLFTFGEKLAPSFNKTYTSIYKSYPFILIPIMSSAVYTPITATKRNVVIEHNFVTGQHVILSMSK